MLYLFTNIKEYEIFKSIEEFKRTDDNSLIIDKLINFAISNGITGNILKKYIIYVLINNKNPYTLAIERHNKYSGNISFVDNDLKYFYDLYNLDTRVEELNNFKFISSNISPIISSTIDEIESKISDYESFKNSIISFFENKGIADMSLYKAFRVNNGNLDPIKNVSDVTFDDLIGYDYQKNLLKENTINFINNNKFNNVLLYGESGTGKSTSIKAVLNEFFDKGLRIIEVYKHQMEEISKIIETLKQRPYYYIIYMDDLSFEENEIEYKYLKSVIEGGIENKPNNVVIYATSNRKHLIRENMSDNGTVFDDLHRSETKSEKLSLAYRFGLQIYYSSLTPTEFKKMVKELAIRNEINLEENILLEEALKWQMSYGSLSGRCAQQFISYIINKTKK